MISLSSLFCTGLYDDSTAIIINAMYRNNISSLRSALVASLVASVWNI